MTASWAIDSVSSRSLIPPAWVAAFVFAAALHAGAFSYLWLKAQQVDDSDALGSPAIEINLDLAAPREDQDNLPPGPAADDSAASVSTAEQHKEIEDKELPRERPVESDDAERVVAPDVPKEKIFKPAKIEAKAQQASDSIASEAAAVPRIEIAKEAPKSTAPSPGTGASAQLIRMAWQKKLVAHINRYKRYPAGAVRRTAQITVAFTLDRVGHVVATGVQSSSGDPAFDQAALTMMRKADPVPPPPPLLADNGLSFSMPVIFQSKGR